MGPGRDLVWLQTTVFGGRELLPFRRFWIID